MKRIISLLLIVAMVFAISACGRTKEGTDKKGDNQEVTTTKNKEGNKESSSKEHMTISIGLWDADKMTTGENDLVLKMLEEKFNVTFEGKGVSWSDYKEKFKLWSAAGELPDVFGTAEKMTETYFSWINQGVVKQIPDDMSKYPNIEKILQKEDVLPLQVDGKYYMLPRTNTDNSMHKLTDRALIIRKDWLEKLGMAIPTNYEEFRDVLAKMIDSDLDGNGVADTVGVTTHSDWALEVFFMDLEPAIASWAWIEQDGQFVPYYLSEKALPGIERMQEMYELGVLDQDFAILQQEDGDKKFAQGNTAAIAAKATPASIYNLKNEWINYDHDKTFEESIAILPLWQSEDGKYYGFNDTTYWSETYINSDISDEKADRIFDIINYLLTDEFKEVVKYGIKDVDYTKEGDKYTVLDPEVKLIDKYPSLNVFSKLASWKYNNEFEQSDYNNTKFGEELMKIALDAYEKNAELVTVSEVNFDIKLMDTPAKNKLSTINFIEDVTKIVVSGDDVQKQWDKVLETYKAKGVEDAIKEVNEKLKK